MFYLDHDMLRPGHMVIHHPSPSVLAAVPDAIAQAVAPAGTTCSVWAVHHAEQAASTRDAYAHERAELGLGAHIEVVELVRPRQNNVIWTDRLHLLATHAPASAAARILGLYVDSAGDAVTVLHHPATSAAVVTALQSLPNDPQRSWRQTGLTDAALFIAQVDRRRPGSLDAYVSPPLLQNTIAALHELGAMLL